MSAQPGDRWSNRPARVACNPYKIGIVPDSGAATAMLRQAMDDQREALPEWAD